VFFRCVQPGTPIPDEFGPRLVNADSKAFDFVLPIERYLVGIVYVFRQWDSIGHEADSRAAKIERGGHCWCEGIACGKIESVERRITLMWLPIDQSQFAGRKACIHSHASMGLCTRSVDQNRRH